MERRPLPLTEFHHRLLQARSRDGGWLPVVSRPLAWCALRCSSPYPDSVSLRTDSSCPSLAGRHCCSGPVLLECRMLDPCSQAAPSVVASSSPSPAYVDVILPRRLHRPFTYMIPPDLKGRVVIGRSVVVPFGSQDLQGLVIAVYHRLPPGAPEKGLKAIRSLGVVSSDHLLTTDQISLSHWVAERYAAPWGQCIKLVLPPVDRVGRTQLRYMLTPQGLASPSPTAAVGAAETELLARLRRRPQGIMATTLLKGDKSSTTLVLQSLVRKGLVGRTDEPVGRRIPVPQDSAARRQAAHFLMNRRRRLVFRNCLHRKLRRGRLFWNEHLRRRPLSPCCLRGTTRRDIGVWHTPSTPPSNAAGRC